VLLVEARERIGGRVWTKTVEGGERVELGAEFVHGRPKITVDLLAEEGLEMNEGGDLRMVQRDGQLRPMPDFWEVIGRVNGQIDSRRDIPYESFLATAQGSEWEKKIAHTYVEGFNAAKARLIGTAAIAAGGPGGGTDRRRTAVPPSHGLQCFIWSAEKRGWMHGNDRRLREFRGYRFATITKNSNGRTKQCFRSRAAEGDEDFGFQ
jgi:hypothetical protein